MSKSDDGLKREIVEVCRLMADRRLVAGAEGNVSARAPDGTVLVTPSGFNKGDVSADMLVRIGMDGEVLEGSLAPTSEKFMHLEMYKQRKGVNGVAHGHPVFATAFAASGRELPTGILPELVAIIGPIPTVPYGRPSSAKLAAAVAPYIRKHNVFLLQNHGATAAGKTVRDAYHRLEVCEAYAKTVWAAELIGGVKPLTKEQIEDLPLPSFD